MRRHTVVIPDGNTEHCLRCCSASRLGFRSLMRFGSPAALQPGVGARIAVVRGEKTAAFELLAQQESGKKGGEGS